MSTVSDLSKKLRDFSKQIISMLRNELDSGKLTKVKTPYYTVQIEQFVYDKGIKSLKMTFPIAYKEEYSNIFISRFDQKIKGFKLFKSIIQDLAALSPKENEEAVYWLSTYSHILARRYLNNELTEGDISDFVTTFLLDIKKVQNYGKLLLGSKEYG